MSGNAATGNAPTGPNGNGEGASVRDKLRGVGGFVRTLSADVDTQAVKRLFDEEAPRAFRTLAGRRDERAEQGSIREVFETGAAVFQGFAQRLSPGRRMLFVAAMLLPLLTFLTVEFGTGNAVVDVSPAFALLSVVLLTVLLALETVDRSRVRDELDVARTLQRDLLPRTIAPPPGWQIVSSYRTANEIGGDYYDFLPLADGRFVVAVGDASGHGMAAGLLMAIGKATLEAAIDVDPSPPAVLAYLNRILVRTGGSRAFMTLFYGVFDPRTGELDYANAGHPFPMHRKLDGRLVELGQGALPLGLRRRYDWRADKTRLEPGEILVLYSDGIVEAEGGDDGGPLGFDKLRFWVEAGGPPARVHDNLWALLAAHHGGKPLEDDATVMVIGRDPVAVPLAKSAAPPPVPAHAS